MILQFKRKLFLEGEGKCIKNNIAYKKKKTEYISAAIVRKPEVGRMALKKDGPGSGDTSALART